MCTEKYSDGVDSPTNGGNDGETDKRGATRAQRWGTALAGEGYKRLQNYRFSIKSHPLRFFTAFRRTK